MANTAVQEQSVVVLWPWRQMLTSSGLHSKPVLQIIPCIYCQSWAWTNLGWKDLKALQKELELVRASHIPRNSCYTVLDSQIQICWKQKIFKVHFNPSLSMILCFYIAELPVVECFTQAGSQPEAVPASTHALNKLPFIALTLM